MSIQSSQFMDSVYYQVSPQQIQRLRRLQHQAVLHQQTGYPSEVLAMPHYQQPLPSTTSQLSHEIPLMTGDLPCGEKFQTKEARRAEHNAIERARRESLNTKFQQLAHSLPNLQNDRRPSKGTIIERTLEFVKQTVQKEERYRNEIRELSRANRQLMRQVTSQSSMLAMSHTSDNDEEDYEESTMDNTTLSRKSSISSFAMQSMSSLPTGSGSSTTTSPSLDYDPSTLYQSDAKTTQQQLYYSDDFNHYMLSMDMPIKYEPSYPC